MLGVDRSAVRLLRAALPSARRATPDAAAHELHNARSIVADLRRTGDAVFERFSVSREKTLAYCRALVSTFQENPAHDPDLVGELDRVSEMGRRPRTHSDPMHRVGTRTERAASSSHQEKDDR